MDTPKHDLTWRSDLYAPVEDEIPMDVDLQPVDEDAPPAVPSSRMLSLSGLLACDPAADITGMEDWRQPRTGTIALSDPVEAALAREAAGVQVLPLEAPAPPPVPDAEQEAIIAQLIAEPFVNLSGTAGVGKTFLARVLAERAGAGMTLCATTGIAAVNLGDASTLNSLLLYYNTEALRTMFVSGFLQSRLRKLRRAGLRKILLDEKSMLSGHQLTFLVRAIDEVNKPRDRGLEASGTDDRVDVGEEDEQPEQIGLILVGDFGQLPPVNEPFAFESAEWQRFADHTVKLTTIRRQSDLPFVQALHAVRAGDINAALAYFTPDKFSDTLIQQFPGTTIFATNDEVDRYNQLRLDGELGRTVGFKKTTEGKQASEWGKIPNYLEVKLGCQVMILANKRMPGDDDEPGYMIYANGDTGVIKDVITDYDKTKVMVQLKRTGQVVPVTYVTRELLEPMDVGRRKELREQGLADKIHDKYEVVGSCTYMPLRVSYATTVHKSQGLTLDDVQINIRDRFFGKPQMLFVALSRARDPRRLRIVGNQQTFIKRVAVDPMVQPWL